MPATAVNLALIRQRLDEPGEGTPTDPKLFNLFNDLLINFVNSLNNTQQHWGVDHFTLTVSQGVEDYIIPAAAFGRPFWVHTTDASNPYHVRMDIPFSLLQNQDQRYVGPQQTSWTYPWSAQEICFYQQNGVWKARVTPTPNTTGYYEIWHEANYQAASLADNPGIDTFHNLIRVQAARSALPLCAWGDVSLTGKTNLWTIKCKALDDALARDEARFQREFDEYKYNSSRDGVGRREIFGEQEDYGGYYGGRMADGWGY